jgi:hypothetical protein
MARINLIESVVLDEQSGQAARLAGRGKADTRSSRGQDQARGERTWIRGGTAE